jgi:hypothetical protein
MEQFLGLREIASGRENTGPRNDTIFFGIRTYPNIGALRKGGYPMEQFLGLREIASGRENTGPRNDTIFFGIRTYPKIRENFASWVQSLKMRFFYNFRIDTKLLLATDRQKGNVVVIGGLFDPIHQGALQVIHQVGGVGRRQADGCF